MDDFEISISLSELMVLVDAAKHVPDVEKSLGSLSRRLDGLYRIYSEVIDRLRVMQAEIDSL